MIHSTHDDAKKEEKGPKFHVLMHTYDTNYSTRMRVRIRVESVFWSNLRTTYYVCVSLISCVVDY